MPDQRHRTPNEWHTASEARVRVGEDGVEQLGTHFASQDGILLDPLGERGDTVVLR